MLFDITQKNEYSLQALNHQGGVIVSEDLLEGIKPEWHDAFRTFITTGEGSPAFLKYLDEDEDAQEAVERAFTRSASALEELGRELREEG